MYLLNERVMFAVTFSLTRNQFEMCSLIHMLSVFEGIKRLEMLSFGAESVVFQVAIQKLKDKDI